MNIADLTDEEQNIYNEVFGAAKLSGYTGALSNWAISLIKSLKSAAWVISILEDAVAKLPPNALVEPGSPEAVQNQVVEAVRLYSSNIPDNQLARAIEALKGTALTVAGSAEPGNDPDVADQDEKAPEAGVKDTNTGPGW